VWVLLCANEGKVVETLKHLEQSLVQLGTYISKPTPEQRERAITLHLKAVTECREAMRELHIESEMGTLGMEGVVKKRGNCKLNRESVGAIKSGLRHGLEGRLLAQLYGVSSGAVSLIKHNKRWQEVP